MFYLLENFYFLFYISYFKYFFICFIFKAIARSQTEGDRLKVLKIEQDEKREELRLIYEKYNELQREIGEIKKS